MESIIKDKYKIIKELGKGSFGKVLEVEDIKDPNRTHYAIKRLNREEIMKNEYLYSAFWKELDIMKECDSENSIKLIENFVTSSNLNIVMELCDEDLEKWVNCYKGYMSEDVLREILIGLNKVFSIMNKKSIVHRDLKLKNIMIKYNKDKQFNGSNINFTPKLIDFGFSKVIDDSNITGTKLGTPATMAPEVLKGSSYTNKCDIWSLGVIIYQMLFKQHPFRARNEHEILNLILKSQGNFYVPDGLSLSKTLNDLMRRMLTVDPKKRISWEEYLNHPFFEVEDKEAERLENLYTASRKLSDCNYNDLYTISKAKNKKTGEYVYIKELSRSFIDSDNYRKDLYLKEIQMMKTLTKYEGPFVRLIDIFETRKTYYIVIEYFEGKILENFINIRKILSDIQINEILRQISEGIDILNKEKLYLESFTTKSLWFKSYKDEKTFELKFFDYGLQKLFNDPGFESSFDLNSKSSLEKKNVLSFGLILHKLCFGVPLFQINKDEDISMFIKNKLSKGEQIKVSKAIPKLVKSLLERTIHFNLDKRYSFKELLEDPYIKKVKRSMSFKENKSDESKFLLSDFKVENLVESLISKSETIISYFSKLLGIKFQQEKVKTFQIDNEIKAKNDYYTPYLKQICIFVTLLQFEIELCYEFLNNKFEDESELHILKINNNKFDYSFCNFKKDKISINPENHNLPKYINDLLNLKNQVYYLLKSYLSKLQINIDEIDTFNYLQESMKNFYLASTEKYFFALFEKGVSYYVNKEPAKALEEIIISKYYFENLAFIRMISHSKPATIEFNSLAEYIENSEYLNFIAEPKQDKLSDVSSLVLVTFLGGIYKTFKDKKIIEEDLTTQSTIGISQNAVESIIGFYPEIIKLAAECS